MQMGEETMTCPYLPTWPGRLQMLPIWVLVLVLAWLLIDGQEGR